MPYWRRCHECEQATCDCANCPFTSISAGPCTESDHTVAEASLLDELEVQPHTIREEPFSAADDHRADNHLELVDQTRSYRLRGEFRTVNSDVVLSGSARVLE